MARRAWLVVAVGLVAGLGAAGCEQGRSGVEIKLAPASALPAELGRAPAKVQEAYRFAIANKALLQQIPCFCGCVAGGHASNYACYVAAEGGPGAVVRFDPHALG